LADIQKTLEIHHTEIGDLLNVVKNLNARVDAYERLIGQCFYAALRDMPDNHDLFNSFQTRHAELYSSIESPTEQDELTFEVISRVLSFAGRSLIENGFMQPNSG
jgi:hypothetical protein